MAGSGNGGETNREAGAACARKTRVGQAHHPWLERRHPDGTGTVFVTEFSRSRQWLLDEHAIRDGVALIPGTGYLELVRAGLLEVEKAQAIDISRVFFQAPFVVANGESKELSLTLQPADSWWDFRIQSELRWGDSRDRPRRSFARPTAQPDRHRPRSPVAIFTPKCSTGS